jgi:hypothetical protein
MNKEGRRIAARKVGSQADILLVFELAVLEGRYKLTSAGRLAFASNGFYTMEF